MIPSEAGRVFPAVATSQRRACHRSNNISPCHAVALSICMRGMVNLLLLFVSLNKLASSNSPFSHFHLPGTDA